MNALQERLVSFSFRVYSVIKTLKSDPYLESCLKQLIRSSTSVGANYREAQSANSMRDFHNKVRISLKEIKEANYWINFLIKAFPNEKAFRELEKETTELMKIMGTIAKKTDPNLHKN